MSSPKPVTAQSILMDLFEDRPAVIATQVKGYGTVYTPGTPLPRGTQFFCANPIINPEITEGRRSHANLRDFNHFIIESDTTSINVQMEILARCRELIYLATFSGNKSIHFVLKTRQTFASKEVFRLVYNDLANRLFTEDLQGKWDPACRDPARWTRLPFGINDRTGKPQRLLHFNPDAVIKDDFTAVIKDGQQHRVVEPCKLVLPDLSSMSLPDSVFKDTERFLRAAVHDTESNRAAKALLYRVHKPGTGHNTLLKGLGALYAFKSYDKYVFTEERLREIALSYPRGKIRDTEEVLQFVLSTGRRW